jgi:hypothetical protein
MADFRLCRIFPGEKRPALLSRPVWPLEAPYSACMLELRNYGHPQRTFDHVMLSKAKHLVVSR